MALLLVSGLFSACENDPVEQLPVRGARGETPAATLIEGQKTGGRERPSFAPTETEVEELLEQIVSPDSPEPVSRLESPDNLTNGRSIMLIYKRRSSSIYALPGGEVWRARATFGISGQCFEPMPPGTAVRFAESFSLSASSHQLIEAAATLDASIKRGETGEVVLPGVRITASGGCVDSLSATAL